MTPLAASAAFAPALVRALMAAAAAKPLPLPLHAALERNRKQQVMSWVMGSWIKAVVSQAMLRLGHAQAPFKQLDKAVCLISPVQRGRQKLCCRVHACPSLQQSGNALSHCRCISIVCCMMQGLPAIAVYTAH